MVRASSWFPYFPNTIARSSKAEDIANDMYKTGLPKNKDVSKSFEIFALQHLLDFS